MKLMRNLDLTIGPTKEFLARQQRAMGRSLKDISEDLSIPVTSLKRLTGDIILTDEQKKKLLHKKKNINIVLNYKDNNAIINGKIKIKLSKKQLFDDEKFIKDIIKICISEIK